MRDASSTAKRGEVDAQDAAGEECGGGWHPHEYTYDVAFADCEMLRVDDEQVRAEAEGEDQYQEGEDFTSLWRHSREHSGTQGMLHRTFRPDTGSLGVCRA